MREKNKEEKEKRDDFRKDAATCSVLIHFLVKVKDLHDLDSCRLESASFCPSLLHSTVAHKYH